MFAGVEVIASFPRAQECKSLIIDLIRENADDRSHGMLTWVAAESS
jgi:hypothetical protein